MGKVEPVFVKLGRELRQEPHTRCSKAILKVVVIFVAKRSGTSVDDIGHSKVGRHKIVETQDRVHLQGARARVAPVVAPAREARGGLAGAVAALLPRGELCIDKEVVHEEDRVLGRCVDVSHDGADAVVAGGVSSVE